jgi:hypothetical protein
MIAAATATAGVSTQFRPNDAGAVSAVSAPPTTIASMR